MFLLLLITFVIQPVNGFSESKPIDFFEHYPLFSIILLNQHSFSNQFLINSENFKEWESDINDKIKKEKYSDALIQCKKMETEAIRANSAYWLNVSYYYSGISSKCLNDDNTALNYFLKILHQKNIPFAKETGRMFKLFRYTGDIYKKKNASPEAMIYYKKCIELGDQLDDKKSLVSPYVSMGIIYSSQHDFLKAKECYLYGLSIVKDRDDYKASIIYNNLGNDEYSQGNFSNAISYYIQSIQLSEKTNDIEVLPFSYNNLGNIYTNDLKDLNKAVEYYSKSLDLEKKAGNKEGIATELKNIGNVYTSQLKFADAEKSLKEALYIFKTSNNSEGIAGALENIGALYSKKGDYNKAIATFLECIELRKENKDEINLANVYNSLGALYYDQKKAYQIALEYYMKGLEFARLKKDKSLTSRIYLGIHEAYAKLGQYDKAYAYLQDYSKLKDTLLNATISKQIIDIQEKYEKNKMQQQVALQTMEIKHKSLQRNGILAFLILAMLIFSSVMYIIFQKRKNEKLLYERNAKIKDREIKNLVQDSEIRSMISMTEGQENERQRISRELHDRVGSLLSLVKLNLSEEKDNPVIKENLTLLDNTYQEVRNISHNLNSGLLNHFGLKAALSDLQKTIESHNSIRFNVLFHEEKLILPKETEEVVFRVLQELITNTLKHAEAKYLDIQVNAVENCELSITVEDDGKGFDPLSKNLEGIGLKNIRYRLATIDGSMEINSTPGKGACFLLNIPLTLANKELVS
jgi:signal transduction histidine kinase